MRTLSVLVGTPVQQRPPVLAAFLDSLDRQANASRFDLSFVFIDDNHEAESSLLLQDFATTSQNVVIADIDRVEKYECDDASTHLWKEALIWRVGAMKDVIIEHALAIGTDYLFFVDSDIVLQPGTIDFLVDLGKDIVSEVFWTKWEPGGIEMPQVWLRDVYELAPRARQELLSPEESERRSSAFMEMLRTPGVYEVGGLGACTLISRNALERGVRFAEIPNLSFWGEDRHFCIRAAALGMKLHADTHLPPLHLYRLSDLDRLEEHLRSPGSAAIQVDPAVI